MHYLSRFQSTPTSDTFGMYFFLNNRSWIFQVSNTVTVSINKAIEVKMNIVAWLLQCPLFVHENESTHLDSLPYFRVLPQCFCLNDHYEVVTCDLRQQLNQYFRIFRRFFSQLLHLKHYFHRKLEVLQES